MTRQSNQVTEVEAKTAATDREGSAGTRPFAGARMPPGGFLDDELFCGNS